jgi:hypothetical protein
MIRRNPAAWLPLASMALFGMLALSACSVGGLGASATPTATPTAAMILQQAKQVKVTDATVTLTLNGTTSGTAFTGSGSGKLTTNPNRTDITFNLTAAGLQIAFETITDAATNTTYTKYTSPAILASDKWKKSTSGAGGSPVDTSSFTNYGDLTNVTLVGKDTVNGEAVWHLKGSSSSTSTPGSADLYLRQDNYYPVKFDIQSTGATSGDITLVFTAVNSGITISLPPADQVQ